MEPRPVEASGNGDHPVGGDAGGDDHALHVLTARDDAVGESVDESSPLADPDRDVSAPDDRSSERLRRQGRHPAVDRAVGVNEIDSGLSEQAPQAHHSRQAHRADHGDHPGGDPCRVSLREQPAGRLARQTGSPPVLEEPANLGENPELLSAETERRLGVQNHARHHGGMGGSIH